MKKKEEEKNDHTDRDCIAIAFSVCLLELMICDYVLFFFIFLLVLNEIARNAAQLHAFLLITITN